MDNTNSQRCRSCLARDCKLKPLSGFSKASENALHMSDVFMMCAAIQITPNDGFSQYACIKCINSAEKAYLFKKQCEHSDKVWNEFKRRLEKDTIPNSVEVLPRSDNAEIMVPTSTPVKNECEADEYQMDNDPMTETGSVEIDDKVDNDLDIKSVEIRGEPKTENFMCKYCLKIFVDEAQFARHELPHTIEPKKLAVKKYAIYGCRKCSVDVKTAEEFIEHCHQLHKESIETLYYRCQLCAGDFADLVRFAAHVSRKHQTLNSDQLTNVTRKRFQCKLCDRSYNSRDALLLHMRKHPDDPPQLSTWPQMCNYCELSLKSHKERLAHLNQEHSDLKNFSCNKCGKTFFHKRALKIHSVSHEESNRFMCQYCGKSLTHPSNLKVHIRIHTGEKPFKCDKCDASFPQWSSLRSHKLIHVEDRNFECKECHKRFLRPRTLQVHMRAHHGAAQKYSCHLCPQQLKHSDSLKKHILTHTNERPCKCKVCGKRFTRMHNLKVHMRTHTGEKPHFCAICKKGFSQAHCLRSHNARFHKDKEDS